MGPDNFDAPLDVEALCDLGGFEVSETRLHGAEGSLQALIFPRPRNRFSVLVDPEPPGGWHLVAPQIKADLHEHRMRFLLCHEVAHTFFFDRERDTPSVIVASSPAQEEFCDRFASELLIPRPSIAGLAPSADAIVDLHRRFRVSVEVAARAFAETHPDVSVRLFVDRSKQERLLQWSNRPDDCDLPSRTTDADPSCSGGCESVVHLPERRQTLVVG